MALFKIERPDGVRDWSSVEVLGFVYTRYPSGKAYFDIPDWFKVVCCVAVMMTIIAVFALAIQSGNRDRCVDYGLQTQQDVKYSGKSGCYYRESPLHQWKKVGA